MPRNACSSASRAASSSSPASSAPNRRPGPSPSGHSAWASFARFVGEGVWHVLIGYDHIAFVLLLLLPSVLRPVDGKWQGATRLSASGARYRHHRHRLHRRAFDHAGAGGDGHRASADAAHRSGHRGVDRRGRAASTCCRGCRACDCRWRSVSAWYTASASPTCWASSMPPARRCCRCSRDSTSAWRSPSSPSWRWCCRSSTWRAARAGMPRGVMPLGSCALGAAGVVWLLQRL